MQRIKHVIFTLSALALLIFGAVATAQADAQVRFVHALVDAPNVSIAVNGETVAENVAFGQASDYLDVAGGDIDVAVTAAESGEALFEQTVTAGAEAVTLIVSSADGFTTFADNLDPLNVGQARLTAVHAIEGGPAVDVVLTDGRPVIAGLEYDTPYGTLDVPVFNYSLNVVPSGESLDSALFDEPISAPLTTGTSYMAVVYGTLDAPEAMLLSAPVEPQTGSGFLELTHNVEDGPAVDVYANDNLVAPSLAAGETTVAFPVPSGNYEVAITEADTVNVLTSASVLVNENATTSATVNADGDTLVIDSEAGAPDIAAQPTADASSEVVVEDSADDTDTSGEVVVAQPQPTPEPAAAQPTPAPATGGSETVTGRVLLDPGANLQLRQYPDPSALSLGLAPSGAVVNVLGREGAPVQIEGLFSQEIQDEIDNFEDPAEGLEPDADLDPANTWLQVSYTTPDSGVIEAWVLSQFLDVRDPDGEEQRLADLPTVPNNDFGEAANTEVTPPPVPEDVVSARVYNLNPGVNLQVRRTPDRFGESLALIPNGTVLEYLGFEISGDEMPGVEAAENAEWAFVRYTPPEGGEITGWVSTQYINLFWRGEEIDFEEMEARTLLLFEDPTTRGELGSGATPPPVPTVDPLEDQVVASVVLDPGANLQFRRDPEVTAESLGLIPSGTQLIVTARDESGDWLLVEFEGQSGWIASDFVRLTFNGSPFEIDELLVENAE